MDAIGNEISNGEVKQLLVGTEEHLKIASETGCLELSVGVETVDNDVMKIINKNGKMIKSLKLLLKMRKNMELKLRCV